MGSLIGRATILMGVVNCNLTPFVGDPLALNLTLKVSGLRDGDALTAVGVGRARLLVSARDYPAFVCVHAGGTVVL